MAENEFPKSDGDTPYTSEMMSQCGHVATVEAGENISSGNVVYIHKTNGKAYVSDTGMADDIRADGIALNSNTTGNDIYIQNGGKYKTSGLSDKADYYLGASGSISTTLSGVRVGVALSTTMLFIQVNQDDKAAIGIIKSYMKNQTGLPSNNLNAFWVACNGQALSDSESPLNGETIPDLNGSIGTQRFLRGHTSSDDGTGDTAAGAATHAHAITGIPASANNQDATIPAPYDTAPNGTPTTSGASLPSYYETVFIMKIK